MRFRNNPIPSAARSAVALVLLLAVAGCASFSPYAARDATQPAVVGDEADVSQQSQQVQGIASQVDATLTGISVDGAVPAGLVVIMLCMMVSFSLALWRSHRLVVMCLGNGRTR